MYMLWQLICWDVQNCDMLWLLFLSNGNICFIVILSMNLQTVSELAHKSLGEVSGRSCIPEAAYLWQQVHRILMWQFISRRLILFCWNTCERFIYLIQQRLEADSISFE